MSVGASAFSWFAFYFKIPDVSRQSIGIMIIIMITMTIITIITIITIVIIIIRLIILTVTIIIIIIVITMIVICKGDRILTRHSTATHLGITTGVSAAAAPPVAPESPGVRE